MHGKRLIEIDGAKMFLILGVVMVHCYMRHELGDSFPAVAFAVESFLSVGVARTCVPLFFMLSGFLIFWNVKNFSMHTYRKKLISRANSLLIPYVLWNIIGAAVFLVKVYAFHFPGFDVITAHGFNIGKFLMGFISLHNTFPYDMPLWFLRNLIVFVVLSPVAYAVGRSSLLTALVTAFCMVLSHDLWGGIYYIMGGRVALHPGVFERLRSRRAIAFSLVPWAVCAILTSYPPWLGKMWFTTEMIRNIAGLPLVLAAGKMVQSSNLGIIKPLMGATFFIYAFHGLLCSAARRFFLGIFGSASSLQVLSAYAATFVSLIVISVILWEIMKSIMPRAAALLCGGR